MDFFVPEVAAFGWLAMGAALGSAIALSKGEVMTDSVERGKGRYVAGGIALAMVLPSLIFLQGEFTAFRGGRALQEREYTQAAELLEDAGRILPFNGRFLLDEGRARLAMGDGGAAESLFVRADTLMRASPYPNWEMGRLAQSREEWSRSLLHLDLALSRYPTSPRIRIDLAIAHLALGDQARAYHLLTEASRLSMFDPQARKLADEVLARMGL
jgi:tetratricopeptide (TPR) repeat protein